MKKFFETLLYSWGSDAPPEVIWALNDLLDYAKSKGFFTNSTFLEENIINEEGVNNNDKLYKELCHFFESRLTF